MYVYIYKHTQSGLFLPRVLRAYPILCTYLHSFIQMTKNCDDGKISAYCILSKLKGSQ
uniref:Uncharacterized protein n=1 Tax=Octopus bimaculoides TaxID=37653 RepID=A0A0L8H626_OCTBM